MGEEKRKGVLTKVKREKKLSQKRKREQGGKSEERENMKTKKRKE